MNYLVVRQGEMKEHSRSYAIEFQRSMSARRHQVLTMSKRSNPEWGK